MATDKISTTGDVNSLEQEGQSVAYVCNGDPWRGLGELSRRLKGVEYPILTDRILSDRPTEEN